MAEKRQDPMEEHVLYTDAGAEVRFRGRLFSESSYFDEDEGSLTRLKLYMTEDNRQVYSVVSGPSDAKSRRVYVLRVEDDVCHINNGVQDVTLHTDMLLTAVFGLCGINPAQAESLKAALEETLKAANS
jgi:hypothetical protein